jgi:glycosyltransferase involved in cell wall biosynthesis
MVTRVPRIAFLSEHASPLALRGSVDAGGQNVYVDEVSRHLGRLGYEVDVFTRRDRPDIPEITDWAPNVRLVTLTAGPDRFLPKDDLWPFMPAFRDAILGFMHRDRTRYDLIHGNFWMSGWVAVELRRRLDVPAVQIFHATGKTKRRHQRSADTSPDERIAVELEIVRQVDRLIAQCPTEQQELVTDYCAAPDRVVVIPSAVNVETFRPVDRRQARCRIGRCAPACRMDEEDFVVVYVGRLLPRKDVRNVVRALALLRQRTDQAVRLLIVGGETVEPDPRATPEIGVLQRLAADLGIADRVVFAGKWQQDMLRYFYSAADVAVTTPWYEPFGLTPLEGMACGRPVVGSAVGGITYTLADGLTGFLVPPRDPPALAEQLHQFLREPALCRQMGAAARKRVERDFTWPLVARRTADLYQELLTLPNASGARESFEDGRQLLAALPTGRGA